MVTKHQALCRDRTLYCVGGVGPEVNLRINNPDINTLASALLTRMYYYEVRGEFIEPPRPCSLLIRQRLSEFKAKVFNFQATRISLDEVVEMYSGRKKTIYTNAMNSLKEKSLNRSDSISNAFVKCEKVNPTKAPRCIQPRNPRYNINLATYLKHNEHRIYKKVDRLFGDKTIMKGYNVEQVARIFVGKWNSFNEPVGLGLDATKFDMSVSKEMLAWEHSCYLKIFKGDEMLKQLLSWQLDNIGRGYCDDGKLKYKVKGKRFSGDVNTALGNCVIMCAMVYAFAAERGVHIKLMNNGDDCMVIMEARDLDIFRTGLDEWFLEMGFRMTSEPPVYNIEEAEFCQMRCITTCNGPIMVRNIPTALAKDTMCILPLRTEREFKQWLDAVGKCGIALCKGVPIMQEFYRAYVRSGSSGSKVAESVAFKTGIHMLMHDLKGTDDHITSEARVAVWQAWGITPDHQVAIENHYKTAVIEWGVEECEDHTAYPHYEV